MEGVTGEFKDKKLGTVYIKVQRKPGDKIHALMAKYGDQQTWKQMVQVTDKSMVGAGQHINFSFVILNDLARTVLNIFNIT